MTTLASNRWYYEYIRAWKSTSNSYYVGGLKTSSGTWVWYTTNEPFTYYNWATGQPDNTQNAETRLTLLGNSNGRWNDYAGYWNAYALCQVSPTVSMDSPTFSPTKFISSCPAGSALQVASTDIRDCVLCPPGKYSASVNSSFCSVCSPGTYSNSYGATMCNFCAGGTYSSGLGSSCWLCSPGYSSNSGSSSCFPCPRGKYSNDYGSPQCTSCNFLNPHYSDSYSSDSSKVCMDDQIVTVLSVSLLMLAIFILLLSICICGAQADSLAMWRKKTFLNSRHVRNHSVRVYTGANSILARLFSRTIPEHMIGTNDKSTLPNLGICLQLWSSLGIFHGPFEFLVSLIIVVGNVIYSLLTIYGQIMFAAIIVARNVDMNLHDHLQTAMNRMESGFNFSFYSEFEGIFIAMEKLINTVLYDVLENNDKFPCAGLNGPIYLLIMISIYLPIYVFLISDYLSIQNQYIEQATRRMEHTLRELSWIRDRVYPIELEHMSNNERKTMWMLICMDRLCLNSKVMIKVMSYCIGFVVFKPFFQNAGKCPWTDLCNASPDYPNLDKTIALISTIGGYMFVLSVFYQICKYILPSSIRAKEFMTAQLQVVPQQEVDDDDNTPKTLWLIHWLPTLDMAFLWHWELIDYIRNKVLQHPIADRTSYYTNKRELTQSEWKEMTRGQLPTLSGFLRSAKFILFGKVLIYNLWVYVKGAIGYWDDDVIESFGILKLRHEWRSEETTLTSSTLSAIPPSNNVPETTQEQPDNQGEIELGVIRDRSDSLRNTPAAPLDNSNDQSPTLDLMVDKHQSRLPAQEVETSNPPPELSAPINDNDNTNESPFTCHLDNPETIFNIMSTQLMIRGILLLLIPYGSFVSILPMFCGDAPLWLSTESILTTDGNKLSPIIYLWKQAKQDSDDELKDFIGERPIPVDRPGHSRILIFGSFEHSLIVLNIIIEKSRGIKWVIGIVQYLIVLCIVFFPASLFMIVGWYILLFYAILCSGRSVVYGIYWMRYASAMSHALNNNQRALRARQSLFDAAVPTQASAIQPQQPVQQHVIQRYVTTWYHMIRRGDSVPQSTEPPQNPQYQQSSQSQPSLLHYHPVNSTATATVYHQQSGVTMATVVPVDNDNVIYIAATDVQVINS